MGRAYMCSIRPYLVFDPTSFQGGSNYFNVFLNGKLWSVLQTVPVTDYSRPVPPYEPSLLCCCSHAGPPVLLLPCWPSCAAPAMLAPRAVPTSSPLLQDDQESNYVLCVGLPEGEYHVVLSKRTEPVFKSLLDWFESVVVFGFYVQGEMLIQVLHGTRPTICMAYRSSGTCPTICKPVPFASS